MNTTMLNPSAAAARSTRMIIENASYSTTPSYTPPYNESHTFSATDHHNAPPTVETLEGAARKIESYCDCQESKAAEHVTPISAETSTPGIKISPSSDCYRTAVAAAAAAAAKKTEENLIKTSVGKDAETAGGEKVKAHKA